MNTPAAHNKERLAHTGGETHLLREIVRTHQVLMMGFSRKVGMPASRFVLMRLLATSEEALGVMELARMLGINAAAVTRQLKDMEAEGLIKRRPDPRDKRRHSVRLSPKGLRIFETLHNRGHELERVLSDRISMEEMKSAAAVLSKLRACLEELMSSEVK